MTKAFTDFFPTRSNEDDLCWEWQGRLDPQGYGRWGKSALAHRESAKRYLPDFNPELAVLHRCDNRRCVRPSHLWQGTQLDNIVDRCNKGRSAEGEDNGSNKLTAADVVEIRNLFESGRITNKSALARKYGVTSQYMGRLLRGDKWKHLGG